jgi:hypothetical protein
MSKRKFKLRKGWTKAMIMDAIRKGNDGTLSGVTSLEDLDGITTCFYRSPKGNKCFIGCLIPDSIYESRMEGNIIKELVVNMPHVEACLPFNNDHYIDDFGGTMYLREMFQAIHDRYTDKYPSGLHEQAQSFLDNYYEDNP